MLREEAQKWADHYDMQTLTTAMGPLMDEKSSLCPRRRKSDKAWSKYIHGASAVFAWHIARSDRVTVLCPPPPQRFHPSGLSYFQTIEEPILRAAIAKGAVLRIDLVHPKVKEAENFRYQLWPLDEKEVWIAAYGTGLCYKCAWRMVKGGSTKAYTNEALQLQTSKPPAKMCDQEQEKTATTAATTSTITSKAMPKKSKKSKKKKKKATCSAKSTDTEPQPSKAKMAYRIATPPPAKKNPATNSAAVDNNNQLSKKQRKALNANAKNLTNIEGSTKSNKNKANKDTKASSQVATASSTKKIPEMSAAAKKRAKKRAKKALRAATITTKRQKKVSSKQHVTKLEEAEKAASKVETWLEY